MYPGRSMQEKASYKYIHHNEAVEDVFGAGE